MYLNTVHLETVNSTSTYARENALNLRLPAIIIADEQSAGRGRRGNGFYSPKGTGMYMSVILEDEKDCGIITPAAAVCVMETVEEITGRKLSVKWVNDLFYKGKKVCGILTERFTQNERTFICIGVGINLKTEEFPDELSHAGSIDSDIEPGFLAVKIAERLLSYIENTDREYIFRTYSDRLFITGMNIGFVRNGIPCSGKCKGINEDFGLITEKPDGSTEVLSSGEISIAIQDLHTDLTCQEQIQIIRHDTQKFHECGSENGRDK